MKQSLPGIALKKVLRLQIFAALALLTGCSSLKFLDLITPPHQIEDVSLKEIRRAGFLPWYPAEKDVNAGEIWLIAKDFARKTPKYPRPGNLHSVSRPVDMSKITYVVGSGYGGDGAVALRFLGNPIALDAAFARASVVSVQIDFGKTTAQRVWGGVFTEPTFTTTCPQGYKRDLDRIINGKSKLTLLGGVLVSSGFQCRMSYTNATLFEANAVTIANILKIGLNHKSGANGLSVWEIPQNEERVIGYSPLTKDLFAMSEEEGAALLQRTVALVPDGKEGECLGQFDEYLRKGQLAASIQRYSPLFSSGIALRPKAKSQLLCEVPGTDLKILTLGKMGFANLNQKELTALAAKNRTSAESITLLNQLLSRMTFHTNTSLAIPVNFLLTTTRSGETLQDIGDRYSTSASILKKLNPQLGWASETDELTTGEVLWVPPNIQQLRPLKSLD